MRVVGDEEAEIVAAVNALRARYTYVFTTGGIGPTHDDITADCVAKAFGVPIDHDPRAVAILQERLAQTGAELNEARMRMTRIPAGADLVLNKVSAAPGFWLGNVIVMAGVPSIMQAMLDEVAPKLKTGVRMLSETVRADAREGDIGTPARRDRQGPSRGRDRQLSVLRRAARRPTPTWSCARAIRHKLAAAKAAVEDDAGAGEDARVSGAIACAPSSAMAAAAPAQPQKPFPVSWDQFHRDARALAWRLAEAGPFAAHRVRSRAAGWCRRRSWRASSASA